MPGTFCEVASQFMPHYVGRAADDHTMVFQVRVLERHFGGMDIAAIEPAHVEDFMTSRLREGKSPATVNRQRSALSVILEWAIMRGLRPGPNPVRAIKKFRENPGRVRYLTAAEAERLVIAAAPHLRPIILTALYTGGRRGEILQLRPCDIDFRAGIVTFRKESSKNRRSRRVPLHPTLAAALRALRQGPPESPLFVYEERPVKSVRSAFLTARKRAKLGNDVCFHSLRHTFASWAVMNGLDIYRLKSLLGHQSVSTTQIYSHLSPDYLAAARQFIGPKGAAERALESRSDSTAAMA